MECYSSALSPNMVGVLQLGAANYRAVKSLCLTSLNAERTSILLRAFVSGGKVPNPRQVASQEHVLPQFSTFPWLKGPRLQITLNFGAQISALKLANGYV
jgi:hypothetical protein